MAEAVGAPRTVLAIEMSQREASVALAVGAGEGERVLARSFAAGARERDPLLPAIDELAREASVEPRAIDLVVVSAGPGGFTGLRIAVTTAKALAFATGAAIVALPSAVVAVAGTLRDDGDDRIDRASVLSAIKREGDVVSGWRSLAVRASSGWRLETPGDLVALERGDAPPWCETDARVVLADRFLPEVVREGLAAAGVSVREPVFDARAAIAPGRDAFARGEVVPPTELLPIYPREPEAVRLWRARHG